MMADINCAMCGHLMSKHEPHYGGATCQYTGCNCLLGAARRDDLTDEIADLEAKFAEMTAERDALCEMNEKLRDIAMASLAEFQDALGYVPEYFRDKWDYDRFIKHSLDALASSDKK